MAAYLDSVAWLADYRSTGIIIHKSTNQDPLHSRTDA